MDRAQRCKLLLFGVLTVVMACIPAAAASAAGPRPDPAPVVERLSPEPVPGIGGGQVAEAIAPALPSAPAVPAASPQPAPSQPSPAQPAASPVASAPTTAGSPAAPTRAPVPTADRNGDPAPAPRRAAKQRHGAPSRPRAVPAAPTFASEVVTSVRRTAGGTPEAVLIAAALALLGVALAGLSVVDRVRREAGMV